MIKKSFFTSFKTNILCTFLFCLGTHTTQAMINQNTTLTQLTNTFLNAFPEYNISTDTNEEWQPYLERYKNTLPLEFYQVECYKTLQNLLLHYTREFTTENKWENFAPPIIAFEQNVVDQNQKKHNIYIGDLHGSITALCRILKFLQYKGYIDDNFNLINCNLFFLGDYVDRCPCGIEVWYTIARIKLKNWNSAFLVRGNHETKKINEKHFVHGGFAQEIDAKLQKKNKTFKNVMYDLYEYLPLNINLFCAGKKISIRHGGINPKEPVCNTMNPTHTFKKIDHENILTIPREQGNFIIESYACYNNADFTTENIDFRMRERIEVGIPYAKKQLKNNNTIFMVRGHQHYFMWNSDIVYTAPFFFYKQSNEPYFFPENNRISEYGTITINAKKDLSVLTLISSPCLAGIHHESFAIHDNKFEMTIYRHTLPQDRHGKYLHKRKNIIRDAPKPDKKKKKIPKKHIPKHYDESCPECCTIL